MFEEKEVVDISQKISYKAQMSCQKLDAFGTAKLVAEKIEEVPTVQPITE